MGHNFSFCEGCETNRSCDVCLKLANGVQEINGETSDGYHTFNELYHHRAVLFSVICNAAPALAWKSKLHDTGDMYDGMFIVGIETPDGQARYHYDIDPYWDMFHIKELERAPKWDGHTPAQAIERISKLSIRADSMEYLNQLAAALERVTPKFVSCPKGFQGVRDTRYYCPNCKKAMRRYEAFCHNCGQAVKYPREVYYKPDNKYVLDWSLDETDEN